MKIVGKLCGSLTKIIIFGIMKDWSDCDRFDGLWVNLNAFFKVKLSLAQSFF